MRDLLRAELQQSRLHTDEAPPCVVCLSNVYEQPSRDLAERRARIQHAPHDRVVSAVQVQPDHTATGWRPPCCTAAQRWSPQLPMTCAEHGVHHGKLSLVSVMSHQPHRHGPAPAARLHLKPAH